MSDGIQYDVSATLKVSGGAAFNADMGRAANSADALQQAFDKVTGGAGRVGSGLMGLGSVAAETVGRVVAVAAALTAATVTGSAMAINAVGKNLAALEGQSNQLTAVVAAATERTFASVQGETNALFQRFKSDAVQSAGGMGDFVDIASKIAAPLLGAGKTMADLRDITKGTVATASALNIEFKQASGDVMRMLQGSAGADLPFFQALKSIPSLGIESAEAFNKLTPEKRIEALQKALNNPAFLAASDAAGDSFKGLWATTEDLAMTIGGLAVSPAFGVLKKSLGGITKTLIDGLGDGGPVKVSLDRLGNTVGYRFDLIRQQVGRIFPSLNASVADTVGWFEQLADRGLARVVNGTAWVADHWPEITDGARRFAGWVTEAADKAVDLVRALGGGDLTKGIERAAMLYGGARVAGPAAQVALGGAQMAQGAWMAGKWASGLFGAGSAASAATAAAGAGEAAAGAAGAAGAGAGSAAGAAGAAGAAAGGAGALATGGLLAGAAAFVATTYLAIEQDTFGFFRFLGRQWDFLMEKTEELQRSASGLGRQLGALWDAAMKLYEALKPLLGVFASLYAIPLAAGFELIVAAATGAAEGLDYLAKTMQLLAGYATEATAGLTAFVDGLVDKLGLKRKTLSPVVEDGMRREMDVGMAGMPVISTSGAMAGVGTTKPKGKSPPAGGKQSVEVVLKWDLGEGNEDAIYVRSRRDITEMIKNAQGFVRGAPLPGRF